MLQSTITEDLLVASDSSQKGRGHLEPNLERIPPIIVHVGETSDRSSAPDFCVSPPRHLYCLEPAKRDQASG